MAINPELHEDDHRELFRIRRELVGWHHATRTTQERMGTLMGIHGTSVHELETGKVKYRLSTLQMWAGVFDLRVQPVIHSWGIPQGAEVPPLREQETEMLWRMARPFEAAKWVRMWVASALSLLRLRAGISPPELGERLGVAASSIYNWERTAHDPLVSKLFTYARGLGGHITFQLMERRDYQYE